MKPGSTYYTILRRVIVIFMLTMSIPTFALTREFFDPHFGTKYDIFCRFMDSINADATPLVPIFDNATVKKEYNIIFEQKISIKEFFTKLSTRAPPH